MDTNKWAPLTAFTNNTALDFGVTLTTFTQNGKTNVMAVWNSDMDGDVYLNSLSLYRRPISSKPSLPPPPPSLLRFIVSK